MTQEAASLRALIDTIADGVAIIDARGLIREFNPACERLFGYARDEVLGRNVAMLMPEPYRAEHDGYLEAYRRTGHKKIIGIGREVLGRRKDGSAFPMELSVGETRLGEGNAYVGIIRDVTERRRAEESAQRLAAIVDSSDDAIISKNLEGIIATWNKGAERLFGYTSDEAIGKSIMILIPPERRDEETEILQHIRAGKRIEHYETIRRRKDGSPVEISLTVSPVKNAAGRVVGASKIARDISERKRSEARMKLLASEVDHRAKNMLAVVQALVRMTRGDDVAAFRTSLEGRIAALAHAHTLLSESRWEGAELRRLIEAELAPYRKGERIRLRVEGPALALTPAAAQSMAMALHELATNAAKYGALSAPGGGVSVEWHVRADRALGLTWTETGGPAVTPPTREGLGTSLIERCVQDQLGGSLRVDWRESGLVCEIAVPADQLVGHPAK